MSEPDLKALLARLDASLPLEPDTDFMVWMNYYSEKARKLTAQLNEKWREPKDIIKIMNEITGVETPEDFRLFPPFYSDFGKNIRIGKKVFINCGCCFQDQGGVRIGDNCLIGHNVVIATLNHGLAANKRAYLYPAAVRIEENVWIGSQATILPGVTIGANSIVAAGALVNKDVPPGVIVGGTPAKFIKLIPA